MSKHTPGPWEVVAGDDYFIAAEGYPTEFPHKFKSDDLGSALAYVGNRPGDFGEANARLIAAAPDMLKALQAVQIWLHPFDAMSNSERAEYDTAVRNMEVAIAKATGVA